MANPGGSSEGGPHAEDASGSKDESAEAFGELAAAFRRKRPQGTARWNFGSAFTRLDEAFGAEHRTQRAADGPIEVPPVERSGAKEFVHRHLLERLRPWVSEQAEAAARRALASELGRVEDGLEATVEALRFLAARVEEIEDRHRRGTDPVDGMAWLVPPPDLGAWVTPVARRLGEAGVLPGPVLHAECGDGTFARALAQALGAPVRGGEPRGAAALAAGRAGISVHVGTAAESLAAAGERSLGASVLSGVVDRSARFDLVALLDAAVRALTEGGTLVVIGTVPEELAAKWGPVAADLVPGRPLHRETWALLFERAGLNAVEPLDGADTTMWALAGRLGP